MSLLLLGCSFIASALLLHSVNDFASTMQCLHQLANDVVRRPLLASRLLLALECLDFEREHFLLKLELRHCSIVVCGGRHGLRGNGDF